MKQTNLSSIFPQTKHLPNANQAGLDTNFDQFDIQSLKTNAQSHTLIKKQINATVNITPTTQKTSQINKSNAKSKKSAQKNSQAKNRDTSGKREQINIKNIAQQVSLSQMPTQASTLQATKKRVQAPHMQESKEVDMIQLKELNNRSDRSKQRYVQKNDKTQTPDQEMNDIDSKKRKYNEISTEITHNQENKQDSKKRKISNHNQTQIIRPSPSKQSNELRQQQQTKISQIQSTLKPDKMQKLSIETQKFMNKFMQNQQPSQSTVQPRQQTPKKNKKSIIKTINDQDLNIEEMKLQDSPPQLKPYSAETLSIISQIKAENSISAQPKIEVKRTLEQIQREELSMKLKHSQLISVKRELVLPVHYKSLLDLQGYLDISLNFLKRCRNQGGHFHELKKSIEQTYGRKFDIVHFRQILHICPDYYTYKWENISNQPQAQLFIDFNDHEQQIGQNQLEERQNNFKYKLYELCKRYYDDFIRNLKIHSTSLNDEDLFLMDIDPLYVQMWYHQFDPHSVEAIPMADLRQDNKALQKRSESVKDFLNKSNIQQSLIQQALEKSIIINNQKNVVMVEQQKPTESEIDLQQLRDLNQRTGLSIETLRLIKAKQGAIQQSQNIMNKSIMLEDNSKKQQQMSKLAEQIRLHLSFKNTNAIYMNELTKVLNDSQRGAFISQDELQNLIEELSRLVPRWMTIKEIKGKLIKTDKSISGQQVQQWIQDHFKGQQSSTQ